jgi:hypothetical protein
MEQHNVWVVVDGVGRQMLGECKPAEEPGVLEIADPIMMGEKVVDPQAGRIELQFVPVCQTVNVPSIEVRWISRFKAPENLVSAYLDFSAQLKAARSGIHLARQIPQGLTLVKK